MRGWVCDEYGDEGSCSSASCPTFPLERAADAIRVVSGRGALGKVVIEVSP